MVITPDDEPRYARNMYRLTKYNKNKLCIKLVFIYTKVNTIPIETGLENG